MIERFDRTGELVVHGDDVRANAVDFRARAGLSTVDWLVEAFVWIDRWMTRQGIATLLGPDEDMPAGAQRMVVIASAMPFDALYVQREVEAHLVFSEYVRLQPGAAYRLHLDGAVVTRPTLRLVAQCRHPQPLRTRKGWVKTRKAS